MKIEGKIAIVTGGASGLGEATVRRYLASGAKVAIFDINDERGQALVNELGTNLVYANVDVTSETSVAEGIQATVDAFGAVHICNNYAGISIPTKVYSRGAPMNLEMFTRHVNINLIGTFNVIRLVVTQMIKQDAVDNEGSRGVIINTSSIAAYEGQVGQSAYSASKGGVIGLTLPLARDLAQYGIRVNTIVPGLMHTPLFDTLPKEIFDGLSASPLYPKRLGKPDEIAHLSQYIVEADYLNAECVRLDAGIRMQPK